MKKLAKTLLSSGHGNIGYIFEMTETEVIALRKHFDGKQLKKGCALELAMKGLKQGIPRLKITQEKISHLLNPRFNHAPYNDEK